MELDKFSEYCRNSLLWLETNFFAQERILQFTFIFIALIISWASYAYIIRGKSSQEKDHKGSFFVQRSFFIAGFAAVILWTVDAIQIEMDLHSHVTTTAASLLTAWVAVIGLSQLIKDRFLRFIAEITVYLIAALTILKLLEPTKGFLKRINFQAGEVSFNLLSIIEALFILVIFIWATSVISRFINKRIERDSQLEKTTQIAVEQIIRLSLLGISVVIALRIVGLDLTIVAFFAAALGLGVGRGLKPVFSNMASGFIMMFDHSIKPGDYIEIGDSHGTVETINSKQTTLIMNNKRKILIPNAQFHQQEIVNWSRSTTGVPVYLRFTIKTDDAFLMNFDKNVQMINQNALEAAKEISKIRDTPHPNCLLVKMNDQSLEFELRTWVDSIHDGPGKVKSALNYALVKRFESIHQNRIKGDPTWNALLAAKHYANLCKSGNVAK